MSAYRPNHSTETATLRVLSDLLQSVDQGDVAVLVLLDLSAAFDTVDHAILVRRLELSFGIIGPALEWFQSYLTGRSQHVRQGTDTSPITSLTCGVPQGSVLGPVLFLLYTAELQEIVTRHALRPICMPTTTTSMGAVHADRCVYRPCGRPQNRIDTAANPLR